jgi:hypothetical protein
MSTPAGPALTPTGSQNGGFVGEPANQATAGSDPGSLARNYDGGSPQTHDVVNNYVWTMTNVQGREDIPKIVLNEHRCLESVLMRQMSFYAMGAGAATVNNTLQAGKNTFAGAVNAVSGFFGGGKVIGDNKTANSWLGNKKLLDVYEEIFPDAPTNNRYIFPYFSKTMMELNTSQWEQIDDAGDVASELAGGASDFLKTMGDTGKALGGKIDRMKAIGGLASGANEALLKSQYPVVGVFDRPRVFTSHGNRNVTIEFPLYNTKNAFDWIKNRNLLYKIMTQNLYNKRDYITGNPPVFYRVLIPGQYFSFASCLTNFKVENLGNTRMEYGSYIVPDAYQVSITLTEMVMPSLNQFQAVTTGEANNRVTIG